MFSIVTIITVIVVVVSRNTEQRDTVGFFAAADQSSDLHLKASASVTSALESIGIVERMDLIRLLETAAETAEEADALLNVEPPVSVGSSYGTMTTASVAWSEGVSDLSATIIAIMDGDLVQGAQRQMDDALDLLGVGDVAYSLFQSSLASVPEKIETPGFSAVAYINPEANERFEGLLYDAQTLVIRIQTSYDLAPHHDVSAKITLVPEPVGETGGIPVVPHSEELSVVAVITNVGNEDEPLIEVTLEIFDLESEELRSEVVVVEGLAAGASTTVEFRDIGIVQGGIYQAKVTADAPEDIDSGNNADQMIFRWRAES